MRQHQRLQLTTVQREHEGGARTDVRAPPSFCLSDVPLSVGSCMNGGEGRLAQPGESRCSPSPFVTDAHPHLPSHRTRQSGVPSAKRSTRPQRSTVKAASTAGFMGSVVRRSGVHARRPKVRLQPHAGTRGDGRWLSTGFGPWTISGNGDGYLVPLTTSSVHGHDYKPS